MEKPQWRATALAIATAVLLGVSASDANALALGRVTVQSALGEPLRAEIEIPEITAEEVSSLRATIASPDAFRTAGFDYNPALGAITITLQRRPDGKHFLRLTSQRAVNEPFMDLILEANWSSGRIVRDYTMLFDPPNLRQAPPPMAAQVTPPAARAPAEQASRAGTPPARTALPPMRTTPAQRAAAERAAAAKPAGEGKQVTVQSGDTAGKIAAAHKPVDVSLDQMLVAMLRANPEAFIGGNINRLRSGAVLEMPSSEEVGLVPSGEARQTIVAQSRDFNEFRRRLAEGLPTTQVGAADRQASGKLQAQVEEKKTAAPTPDKLTLSKGAIQDKANADKIARDRAAQDAATRLAELNKNIADLNKLGTGTTPAAAGASAAKPGVALPLGTASAARPASAPAMGIASDATPAASAVATPAAAAVVPASSALPPAAVASAVVPAAAAPASAVASLPVAAAPAASTPAVPAPAVAAASKPQPAPVTPPETTLIDDMLENPIVPATIGGLLAFLLGFAFYRSQQRKKSTQVDSSFLESRLQPDSFFGASGGQRIDTNEGSPTGSSMVYSPSQLDAAGDVDPVAEADVYLAYGRDLQAEEILKEAMRTTPQRVAVHSKLLEIYSKRRDAKAFELVATEAYALTHGQGPDWEHICELGQELDPSNPLYRPGGQPDQGAIAAATAPAPGSFGATTATQALPVAAAAPVELDLDLDFSVGDDEPSTARSPAAAPISPQSTLALNVPPVAEPMPALDMDFGSATVALELPAASPAPTLDLPQVPPAAPARLDAPDLTLSENSLNFDLEPAKAAPATAPAPAVNVAAAAAPAADAGMIEFDLGALSLDLDSPAPTASPATAPAAAAPSEPDTADAPLSTAGAPLSTGGFEDTGGDPLATKLALAQEFNAIGDPDGARSLAEEVVAEASGDLKNKAQRFLAEIS
ncbi:MAG: FimV/HubP family polar landmark protein [Ramlibacter sp.]|nr:FimV/HubP family polar landmark protein [Ramlibacter sp.]